jgi:hypothetical protein
MLQWYGNVPAVFITIAALVEPGAIVPVSNAPVFDVAVCAVLSLFCHATFCPTFTVIELGANAKLLMLIVTSAPPPGEGEGEGLGDGDVGDTELLPHATAKRSSATPRLATAVFTQDEVMSFLQGGASVFVRD